MAELRVEDPRLTEQFTALFAADGLRLPVDHAPHEPGEIVDADGREVCTIDVNRERSDDEVLRIASWIILAVNTCGGFRGQE